MEKNRFFPLPVALTLALLVGSLAAEGPSRLERLRWAAEAQTLLVEKKYDEASRWLEKAVSPGASARDLAEWWPALGHCYEAVGNYQKALTAYQQAQQLQPKSVESTLDLARVYALVELNEKAIVLYERALSRERQRKDVMRTLAELYARARRWDQARDLAERYLRLEPQDDEAQKLMARIEEALGDLASAARRWEGLLAVHPTGEGHFYAGQLWARQEQFDLAERAYEKAAASGFSTPAFFIERGLLAWRRGDHKTSTRHWKRALEAAPGLAAARFLLALVDASAGRRAEAAEKMRGLLSEEGSGYVKDLAGGYLAAQEKQ